MTYRKILIRGGRIWDGTRFISGDVAIGDGKILAIGQAPDDFRVYLKYDAEGAIVSPGLVELHAHLLKVCLAPRLPGKCAPLSAAMLMKETIYNIIAEQEEQG